MHINNSVVYLFMYTVPMTLSTYTCRSNIGEKVGDSQVVMGCGRDGKMGRRWAACLYVIEIILIRKLINDLMSFSRSVTFLTFLVFLLSSVISVPYTC